MVDFMEIETAFHTLVGIIIVAVVLIAVIAIALGIVRGSRTIAVKECIPADYITTNPVKNSVRCGAIDTGIGPPQTVYCNDNLDICMDTNTNKCCPTSDGDVVFYSQYRCCKTTCSTYTDEKNCTDASCKWCSGCEHGIEQRAVNRWHVDKCVAPGANCGYHCEKNVCSASCDKNSDCILPLHYCSISTGRCDCELGT